MPADPSCIDIYHYQSLKTIFQLDDYVREAKTVI